MLTPSLPHVYFFHFSDTCSLGSTSSKVEALITNKGPIADVIFKCHTFLRHIYMHAIDASLKLKLSRIGSSTLLYFGDHYIVHLI
jgi:hypothetical protein